MDIYIHRASDEKSTHNQWFVRWDIYGIKLA